ncbi:hypothetical protein LJ737_19755 [Hymenobacter sp. 15J16-1T3B]|uniref:hypothetical protein n=1 Tax=Hymenobacter sp. 15J16-1T3B TaxID=2886941 RepID=UPI001D0F5A5E|nr:hypothetical protein [Hymenobacter sp. 15J16-1T3B]MCC3159487.1 hypothetical protein [Hymenobacter sp. 15J16-1T3B]
MTLKKTGARAAKPAAPAAPATVAPAKPKAESYDIRRSDETLALAKDLANFIKENKLSTQVQGKEFVNVEGWQYAGSRLGIVPIVDHLVNLSTDTELKYQAKVTLFDLRSQHTVGAGFAICSNKEQGKKFYQEFAISSMAQTRAIGKAYRNILAWIIRAAGYEPTPAEEMEYGGHTQPESAKNATAGASKQPASPRPAASATSAPSAAPAPMQAVPAEPAQPAYATAEQKEEVIRLLNHPVVTRQERTKMLLNINKLDQERAAQAIANLKKTIENRENAPTKQVPPVSEKEQLQREVNGARQDVLEYLDRNEAYFDHDTKKERQLKEYAWNATSLAELAEVQRLAEEAVAALRAKADAA